MSDQIEKQHHTEEWHNQQRIVMDSVFDDVEKIIDAAENETDNCCADCGVVFGNWNKNDRVVTNGWITILCSKCARERGINPDEMKKFWNDIAAKHEKKES